MPLRRSLSQSRTGTGSRRPSTADGPVPPLPISSKISQDEHRKLVKPFHSGDVSRVASTRTSVDVDRSPRTIIPQQRPQLPSGTGGETVAQQRVFIGDMQRFNMVQVGSATTAGDVIQMIEDEGSLVGWVGSGGWMVFEVAQDFGMERPIRSFELIAEVQASWNKDKMVNCLVLKMTPLGDPLSRSAIPSSSPTHSGYVEWEVKRGKWSKRWMQLREHSIWLSKRDNGRDEVLLCSLSNFDAYRITRSHRAPKPFAFAVKSTDNLSYFENTADYLHSFACSEKDGKVWLEKILVARSYVLHQERHVLFNPKSASSGTASVSRSNTKKISATFQRPAAQPLVALPPLYTGAAQSLPQHDVFEPGSLLSKHI
ncbi:hypothetical protein B0H34DRAFT_656003 [Crassisporium funariophilum]|nr:hypothetical protein B0H34DRAFT_656003 [Crassisporium funariophilum]